VKELNALTKNIWDMKEDDIKYELLAVRNEEHQQSIIEEIDSEDELSDMDDEIPLLGQ